MGWQKKKWFEIITRQTRCRVGKKLSIDGIRANIIFSLRLCMVCVTDPDTIIASEDYLGVRKKGNPPYNAEDNLHAGLLVIESQVHGLLRESWTKGSSGVRPVIHGPD